MVENNKVIDYQARTPLRPPEQHPSSTRQARHALVVVPAGGERMRHLRYTTVGRLIVHSISTHPLPPVKSRAPVDFGLEVSVSLVARSVVTLRQNFVLQVHSFGDADLINSRRPAYMQSITQ